MIFTSSQTTDARRSCIYKFIAKFAGTLRFGCNQVYCENYMKQRNTVCGQDAEFLYVAAGDTIRLMGFINLLLGNVNNALTIFFTFG